MCAKCAPPRRSALKRKVLVRWGGPRGAVARCDAPSQGRRWGRPAAGESYETVTGAANLVTSRCVVVCHNRLLGQALGR